tara:strand:+ start:1220 stop:1837 length:618 start_codon:yes stop_codon:yes gene_type:complete
MSDKSSSKPYKNSGYIRSLVSTQLLMELNLNEFIKNNQIIKLSKKYSLNEYSKDLDKTWIELLCMGEFDGEWNENTFNEFISPIERQKGSKVILENNTAIAATFASAVIYENKEIGRLDFVVTHPDHRKKGLGKNICIAVINHFIEKKYEKVILQTDDWRIPAIAVYLKLGFKPVFTTKELEKRWNEIMNTYFIDLIIKSIKPDK